MQYRQTILFQYGISFFKEMPSWSGDFQLNANKVAFISESVSNDTLAKNTL